jgi:hypothetical protein
MPAGVSAHTALANVTLGSSAAGVTFSNINQGYRDLVLIMSPIGVSDTDCYIRLNGNTGFNYPGVWMYGQGSGSLNSGAMNNFGLWTTLGHSIPATSGSFTKIEILDYSVTDKHKPVLTRANLASGSTDALAQRFANTAAITSVFFQTSGANFAAGSTFALYGVSA